MVIRLTLDNRACPIHLFRENEPHHLMGKGHSRQGNFLVCPLVDGLGKTIRTTDDEDQAPCRLLLSLKPFGKYGDEFEGHVVADALNIVVDASYEMLVYGFPNE